MWMELHPFGYPGHPWDDRHHHAAGCSREEHSRDDVLYPEMKCDVLYPVPGRETQLSDIETQQHPVAIDVFTEMSARRCLHGDVCTEMSARRGAIPPSCRHLRADISVKTSIATGCFLGPAGPTKHCKIRYETASTSQKPRKLQYMAPLRGVLGPFWGGLGGLVAEDRWV